MPKYRLYGWLEAKNKTANRLDYQAKGCTTMMVGDQYTLHFTAGESQQIECVLASYKLPPTNDGLKEFLMMVIKEPESDRSVRTVTRFIQQNPELVRMGAQMLREIPAFLSKKVKRAL